MNKSFFILSICLIAISLQAIGQNKADQICGTWLNEEKDSHIKIYQRDGKFYGKVVWLKEPLNEQGQPKTDLNNANPALRNRPIMGMEILSGLEYQQGKWENGSIYGPRRGESAECSATLADDGTLKLSISQSFFSVTKTFTRI